jgi:mono/diheme cytochrome c family protein
MKRIGTFVAGVVVTLVVLAVVAGAVAFGGLYDVAGDTPHTGVVYAFLQKVRSTSITARARDVKVPADLASPQRIAKGAAEYGEMCAQCHLGPGVEKTEISQGLYPSAPHLAKSGNRIPAAREFWGIKHGIKFTAMPAWGKTHSDELLWDIVAFVRAMPEMSPAQYHAMTANAEDAHHQMMQDMGAGVQTDQHGVAGHHGDAGHVH